MQRFSSEKLKDWLVSNHRKPLVIRGARQVGKSTLVRQFAHAQELTLHEVNLERHLALTDAFSSQDTQRILRELEFICGKGPIKGEGDLLFLDEIQAVPIALQSLRYLYEDRPELPVVAAGSLLEFALSKHSFSMPVGRIEYLFLGPMTFAEMLEELGEDVLLDLLRQYQTDDVFPLTAHERLLELQRVFLLVGGMPEAVQRYSETRDMAAVADVHAAIIETYRDDFAKYATQTELLRLHKVFDYVPAAVGKKFKYVQVDPHERARELHKAVDLLAKAQVVTQVFHTDASGLPLRAGVNWRIFKPYLLDGGLMNHMCGVEWLSLEDLKTRAFVNEGQMAEQFIAQHLLTLGRGNTSPTLHYWLREGRANNAEVDFVLQLDQVVSPVEVKAGRSGSLKSLLQFAWQKGVDRAVRFDLNPPTRQRVEHGLQQVGGAVDVEVDLLSLPLYMVEELPRLFGKTAV